MKLKEQYNKKTKVLQLDGGGVKGVMFLAFLSALEKVLGKPCCEIFDLVIGTSTGGITAALIAAGYPADWILKMYKEHMKKIFKKRFLWVLNPVAWATGSRYNRKYVDNLIKEYLDFPMKECKTHLIITGINMKDARHTHFFKSYKAKYMDVPVYAAVSATYSAPTYFGYYYDEKDLLKTELTGGGVWADGGCGTQNCTATQAYIETKRLHADSYWILSCGCGYTGLQGHKKGMFKQIKDFLPIAREQSITEQIRDCMELGVNLTRADGKISHKLNALDNADDIPEYEHLGNEWARSLLPEITEADKDG